MNHKMSVKNLVQHLQNIYSLPPKSQNSQNIDEDDLKTEMSKLYRGPWKTSGTVQKGFEISRLPIGDLDNWQILRTNLSKRSYQYPKKYKGIKISGIGRQFEKYSDRDKNGKMPYLYESDIPKIERIRKKIYTKTFKTTNTVKHDLFGFPSTNLKKDRRPYSLQTLDKLEKIQH